MKYVGNLSQSEAKKYSDRQYTHSTTRHGKEVRWYDCWIHADEMKPAFGEELDKGKVSLLDRIFRSRK